MIPFKSLATALIFWGQQQTAQYLSIIHFDNEQFGMYQQHQIKTFIEDLQYNLYGNTHSINPSAAHTDKIVTQVRMKILNWLGFNADLYTVIFIPGLPAALKLIYIRQSVEGQFGMFASNNNNINAQIEDIQNKAHIFLDISSIASTIPIAISKIAVNTKIQSNILSYNSEVDYVFFSLDRIFGIPLQGLSVLVAKDSAMNIFDKTYFGGGTVTLSLAEESFKQWRPLVCSRFEDGTVPFLSIVSADHGFQTLDSMIRSGMNRLDIMQEIFKHTQSLYHWAVQELGLLKHTNGQHICRVINSYEKDDYIQNNNIILHQPLFSFDLLDVDGLEFSQEQVIIIAERCNISLGTSIAHPNKKSIRVSLGYLNTFNDIEALISFVTFHFKNISIQQFNSFFHIHFKSSS
ncbi:MAG: putative molybdenum cofactor sulfurase [Streblomastix strix]|uniref:Putative molybdenum cofactor sulfurase n=1 Tax=Streblomastix strix TaxID=222440 RepID=A0A5J4VNT2_9EUKA|nr:MAG: putative molybdenum cofactor sulfurase [Streblomastix strix]